MRLTIILFVMLIFCSFAWADNDRFNETCDLKIMNRHLEKIFDGFNLIGNVHLVYPYGHGIPDCVGYFKVSTKDYSGVIVVKTNLREETISTRDYESYEMVSKFLDSNFVRSTIKKMSGQCVEAFHLVSCGGEYTVIDCLNIPRLIFWQAYLEDGQEVFFYYAMGKWIILKASDQRKLFFKNQKDAIIVK